MLLIDDATCYRGFPSDLLGKNNRRVAAREPRIEDDLPPHAATPERRKHRHRLSGKARNNARCRRPRNLIPRPGARTGSDGLSAENTASSADVHAEIMVGVYRSEILLSNHPLLPRFAPGQDHGLAKKCCRWRSSARGDWSQYENDKHRDSNLQHWELLSLAMAGQFHLIPTVPIQPPTAGMFQQSKISEAAEKSEGRRGRKGPGRRSFPARGLFANMSGPCHPTGRIIIEDG